MSNSAEAGEIDLCPEERLRVSDLQTHFIGRRAVARAVDGVSFSLEQGRTLAVVGESGSGKSVTALSIMGLLDSKGRVAGGSIRYRRRDGNVVDVLRLPARAMRSLRGPEIAMIFQEPMTSLNPLFTIGDQVAEMVLLHEPIGRRGAMARAEQMLNLVEIPAAAQRLNDYPHQLSGGMRQRVMIALALACNPSVLIADEPTTALDVTIQAQILDLLRRLQAELGMSILFITHNLSVVAEIAHRAVVMYAGRVVEDAAVVDLFRHQRHPYTRGLLACVPNAARDQGLDGRHRRLTPIPGRVPPITALPPGCSFAPRCPFAEDACANEVPRLVPAGPGHLSSCLRHAAL
jgi:peptide/nickel transport system ATP-binding protein